MSLLASRPGHAHERCDEHQAAGQEPETVTAVESNDTFDSKQLEDLTLQGSRELIRTFHRLQESRVQIYADFTHGFHEHQRTERFPAFCSGIMERFSSVSKQINHVEKLLRDDKELMAVADSIRMVQLQEKEKLLLTSALLIEKMRLSDVVKRAEYDESTVAFLERSTKTLKGKHTDCVVRLNEILDDLRANFADLYDKF